MKSRLIDVQGVDAAIHETAMKWWTGHGWAGVPAKVLPKCGIIIEDEDGTGRAVGWLYMDNSVGVAMLEWVVTNPANSGRQSFLAISYLTQAAQSVADELDYGVILTTAKQPALVRMYERTGFTKTDEGMTHLIMLRN